MSEALQARLQGLKAKLKQSESKNRLAPTSGQNVISRTESESSDVKITHEADQVDGTGRSVGSTALASGFTNRTSQGENGKQSSNKVDSPLHREPPYDAQRDVVRQLQDANEELKQQLQQVKTLAAEREAEAILELEGTRRKLDIMKEQLMTGQADAEETGRQILEQAMQEMHAKHALELQRVNTKMEEQNSTILMLEQKLSQQHADSTAASENLAAVEALKEQLAQQEADEAAAREECNRLQAECSAKAQQVASLEVAMGELTFAAERAQTLELSTCQAQEEAKQANDAAHHAQGAAFAAQQDLAHERTRAQELQVRCLQAEEQCAKMVMQIQSLHAKADSQDAELTQWQQHSLGPSDRDKIIEMIGKLFTSETDGVEDLNALAEALRMNEAESAALMQQGQQLRKSRGLLHGIRALPGRLLGRPNGYSGTPKAGSGGGLGTHWVQFLTEDEPVVSAGTSAPHEINPGADGSKNDSKELPVSVPSA